MSTAGADGRAGTTGWTRTVRSGTDAWSGRRAAVDGDEDRAAVRTHLGRAVGRRRGRRAHRSIRHRPGILPEAGDADEHRSAADGRGHLRGDRAAGDRPARGASAADRGTAARGDPGSDAPEAEQLRRAPGAG
jgi:hypothetical protein